jgi:hypothetical protein
MTDSKCACDESLRLRERVLLLRHFIDTAAWSILRDSGKPATAVAHWLEGRLADDNRLAQAEETSAKTDSEPGGTLTTDGAPLGTVARGVFACALAWEPDARLLGNVRAADIARLAEFVLKAEETSVEEKKAEPYKPKVGDRVRLVSSPDDITDSDKVGQTWAITGIRQGTGEHASDPSYHWRVRNELATWDTFIHRDAVWEPVAEKPEPPASELSDGALEEIFLGFASIRLGYRALYDAGRAKAENELVRLATGLIEAFEAECEPEADADDGDLPPHKAVDCAFRLLDEKTARIAKLEAERAAHAATKAELDEVIRGLYARLREVHADARKARPMPSREAVSDAVFGSLPIRFRSEVGEPIVRSVWALFGAQEEQDSAPERDERPWNYDAPPDSEIGQLHELLDSEHAVAEDCGRGPLPYTGLQGDDPSWDSDRLMGRGWSVKAWRRAAPAQQPLDGMPKPPLDGMTGNAMERLDKLEKELATVTAGAGACIETVFELERRIKGLELDGRAVRRWIEEDPDDGELPKDTLARIEAEEKGW